jgi:predicted Rdx family selenoprotein
VEAELKEVYPDSVIELIKGGGGIFDVKCNDILIFSRQNVEGRRFPKKGEISKLIKEKVGKF